MVVPVTVVRCMWLIEVLVVHGTAQAQDALLNLLHIHKGCKTLQEAVRSVPMLQA